MFLMGVKFALGLVAGWSIALGIVCLVLAGAAFIPEWRAKRRRRLWRARERVRQPVAPGFREQAVLCFRLHTDDWIAKRNKSESPR